MDRLSELGFERKDIGKIVVSVAAELVLLWMVQAVLTALIEPGWLRDIGIILALCIVLAGSSVVLVVWLDRRRSNTRRLAGPEPVREEIERRLTPVPTEPHAPLPFHLDLDVLAQGVIAESLQESADAPAAANAAEPPSTEAPAEPQMQPPPYDPIPLTLLRLAIEARAMYQGVGNAASSGSFDHRPPMHDAATRAGELRVRVLRQIGRRLPSDDFEGHRLLSVAEADGYRGDEQGLARPVAEARWYLEDVFERVRKELDDYLDNPP